MMNSAEYLCCNREMKFIEPVMIMDTRRGEETPCCPRCQSPRVKVLEEPTGASMARVEGANARLKVSYG